MRRVAGSVLAVVILTVAVGQVRGEMPAFEVTEPPEDVAAFLELDPFYTKYVSVEGFPIVSSEKVADAALLEAAYIVWNMLEPMPHVREAMIANRTRLAIMAVDEMTTHIPEHSDLRPAAYWNMRARGLGATRVRPAVSAGEENLLHYRGDPYVGESILVHEFAHAIHQMGLETVDETFNDRLRDAYEAAMAEGLWEDAYAAVNTHEYWAEGVQSWFDTNRGAGHAQHNHVKTRELLEEYDPRLAALIAEVFGGTEWRYTPPSQRAEMPHLRDFDLDQAPRFAWPTEVREAFEAHQRARGERRGRGR